MNSRNVIVVIAIIFILGMYFIFRPSLINYKITGGLVVSDVIEEYK